MASTASVSIGSPGDIWLLVPESHKQNPNSSIEGAIAVGGGFGTGSGPVTAVIGSHVLFGFTESGLLNDQPYDGSVVPEIGPLPLVQNVSFIPDEGDTFSSVSSSHRGAAIHELTKHSDYCTTIVMTAIFTAT